MLMTDEDRLALLEPCAEWALTISAMIRRNFPNDPDAAAALGHVLGRLCEHFLALGAGGLVPYRMHLIAEFNRIGAAWLRLDVNVGGRTSASRDEGGPDPNIHSGGAEARAGDAALRAVPCCARPVVESRFFPRGPRDSCSTGVCR